MSKRPSLIALLLAVCAVGAADAQEAFKIVVHPSVPGTSVERKTLGAIYLKQVGFWSDGTPIAPVDQSASASLRARFTEYVFGQPVAWVTNHWARQMTSGKGWPPAVKSSDEQILEHVARTRGAIGYVTAAAVLGDSVKVLEIIE